MHSLREQLIHSEKYANTIRSELEDTVSDSANAYKTIRKLENDLNVVSDMR